MKALKLSIAVVVLAAALLATWLIRGAADTELQRKQETQRQQGIQLDGLSVENKSLSNALARTKNSFLPDNELAELLKLRKEAGQLQRSLSEAEPLRREISRLRAGLQEMETNDESGIVLTALLADEMEVRRARVAKLQRWLEETPSEKIPELQFVSDLEWLRAVENPFVRTDDEYRRMMSNLRFKGERLFSSMALAAIQKFGQANDGSFPTDLSQLKPYFTSPIDDDVLERYQIIPVTGLNVDSRAGIRGDWVITEKAPVNRELDPRIFISSRGITQLLREDSRWDSPPPG